MEMDMNKNETPTLSNQIRDGSDFLKGDVIMD